MKAIHYFVMTQCNKMLHCTINCVIYAVPRANADGVSP